MPGLVDGEKVSKKRKSDGKDGRSTSSKRRAVSDSENELQQRIETLENQITESRKHLNNVATLISMLKGEQDVETINHTVAVSLCRVFSRLMASGSMSGFLKASDQEKVVLSWLIERYDEYKNLLAGMISRGPASVHGIALELTMRLVKEEAAHLYQNEESTWKSGVFKDVVIAIVQAKDGEDIRRKFTSEYVKEYDDVRYFTFSHISEFALTPRDAETIDSIIAILSTIDTCPGDAAEIEHFYIGPPKRTKKAPLFSLTSHKKRGQEAWLSILNSSALTIAHRKTLLNLTTSVIVPWFLLPELLMDFLTASYDAGGSLALLSLSGLFHLITIKNLDYPQFYPKLYSILDADLLHSKHRSSFFRQLAIFLGSSHLPATLVASFIKRLSRLALLAPPAAIVAIVPFIYNLFKLHPSCTFMLHRVLPKDATDEDEWGVDPFDPDETDPTLTDAISSSLWEIETLQSHYHPNVASLCRIISEQFTKQRYTLEDFLDHSYRGMIDSELARDRVQDGDQTGKVRRRKKEVVVEWQIPKRIFTTPEEGEKDERGILGELWTFD